MLLAVTHSLEGAPEQSTMIVDTEMMPDRDVFLDAADESDYGPDRDEYLNDPEISDYLDYIMEARRDMKEKMEQEATNYSGYRPAISFDGYKYVPSQPPVEFMDVVRGATTKDISDYDEIHTVTVYD